VSLTSRIFKEGPFDIKDADGGNVIVLECFLWGESQ